MGDSDRKILVQYGAGNIGRSFIGQIFAGGGWDVVYLDIDKELVIALNESKGYTVKVKSPTGEQRDISVKNYRAVDAGEEERVITEIAQADLLCTSVGQGVLSRIAPLIAKAVTRRRSSLDIILAENIRMGRDYFISLLKQELPQGFPIAEKIGVVETSIGKMVPIMKKEDLKEDSLVLFAEPYNKLIVDKKGFIGDMPLIRDIEFVDNIKAYVDRKLFIHNLGHAAAAYLGYRYDSGLVFIWEVMEIRDIRKKVRRAMEEAASALLLEYPGAFTRKSLEDHMEDLLFRFGNKALGDTIFRVGKDLPRKLGTEDRIIGAIKLAEKHLMPSDAIRTVLYAACGFKGKDDRGKMFPEDVEFHRNNTGESLIGEWKRN